MKRYRLTGDVNESGEIVGKSWKQINECSLPLGSRRVNEYAEFTTEHTGFQSSAASKDRSERALPIIISGNAETAQAIAPTHLYTQPVIDYQTGGQSHPEYPGVTISTVESRSGTNRSYNRKKLRIQRKTVTEITEAGKRLVTLEFRSEKGGSRKNPGYSRFKPGRAVELFPA
jgi:hypothetical protein